MRVRYSTVSVHKTHLPDLARNQGLAASWGSKEKHATHVVDAQLLHNVVWENTTRKGALENLCGGLRKEVYKGLKNVIRTHTHTANITDQPAN